MLTIENYEQALDYLYSFVDYSLVRSLQSVDGKFDLSRIRKLMARLEDPHLRYPVVHIAGTKGKGSVSSLCASALRAAGYTVGLYTSPHLHDYAERIQVNGEPIAHAELVSLLEEIRPVIEEIPELTTFEITTALGFLYFSRKRVDVAVVEVGLGGRLDATNVVDPLVSVITTLSYDHMAVLGDTLAKIAGEKAGIIKPQRPVVSAPQKEEALKVLQAKAMECESPFILAGSAYRFTSAGHDLDGQGLLIWQQADQPEMDGYIEGVRSGWRPLYLRIPLLGRHQIENAVTAYSALDVVRRNGLPIRDEAIQCGFASVVWPCRFELLRREAPLIADSAHNTDSAQKLRLALDDYFPGRPVVLIFGASEDKDVHGMFDALLPRVRQVIATQAIHPRALDAQQIVALAHESGCSARAVLPLPDALSCALEAAKDGAVIVATGSLFIAAAVREAWQANQVECIAGEKNR